MNMRAGLFAFAALQALGAPAQAEVVSVGPDHYTLREEAHSPLSQQALWDRLVEPSSWWHPDHSYSGDAGNLSLDLQAGGLWREDWEGGSVAHGRVLMVMAPSMLRLDAPFGPLQGMGVTVVWTITLEPDETGTRVVFDEVATGSVESGLDEIAPLVDGVKTQALARLVTPATAE